MQRTVNLAAIVRMAGNSAVERMIVCGKPNLDRNVTREAIDHLLIEERRSLAPVIERLKEEDYEVVALEQATNSESLYRFAFARRTVLIVGNERSGISEELLGLSDRVAEIPVYGPPHSHNAATAASLALYEYCRQFPQG
jgi:tRNA G18 (ribose-2'-O)-methylase SpoU